MWMRWDEAKGKSWNEKDIFSAYSIQESKTKKKKKKENFLLGSHALDYNAIS